MVFAKNFMDYLRGMIASRVKEIQNPNANIKQPHSDQRHIEDFKKITKYEICKKNFELDMEENNIK